MNRSANIKTWSALSGFLWNQLVELWPLVIPLLVLLSDLGAFPYPGLKAPYSDITVSHYPNAIFLRRAILEWRTIPLWSPTILSGYPLAANPLSGLWYPLGWLALLFPLPLGFNLLVLLHLLWGGLGMYTLLRLEGLGKNASLFGALAFESMPKLFAHYGAGHLTLLYAVPWTPWLLAAQRKDFLSHSHIIFITQPGMVLGLIFLADPRWAAYAGLCWGAYALIHGHGWRKLICQAGLAALLSAPLALPLLEYTALSTRAHLRPEDVFVFSLPAARLLGLLFPDLGGYQEWVLYPGSAILTLAVLAALWRAYPRSGKFWIGVFMASLVFSLGSQVPLLSFLAYVPGFSLLRVPSRALFLTGMSLVALASSGLQHLEEGVIGAEGRRASLSLTALAGFAMALALGVWFLTGTLSLDFTWGAGFVLAVALLIGLCLKERLSKRAWWMGLLILSLLDLGGVNYQGFALRPVETALSDGKEIAEFLATQSGRFRVYSPSYSLPQHMAVLYSLEQADGVDPLHLESYKVFMEDASGVPWPNYSVSVPPMENGEPALANAHYRPDPVKLGLLNVRYVVAAFDLPVEGLRLRKQFGDVRVFENLEVMPRAWVEAGNVGMGDGTRRAQIVSWSPNRIELVALGPGRLVVSEIAYPGWQVSVDGQPAALKTTHNLLRGVDFGPGSHRVIFTFRPWSVYAGLGLFVIGVVLIFLISVKSVYSVSFFPL